MGMGDVIQSEKALARAVSCGLISCFIALIFFVPAEDILKNLFRQDIIRGFKGYLHNLSVIRTFENRNV
jgi:hypothetical protein